MSRVGKNPITIPEGVSVEILENKIIVKGKLGEIEQEFSDVSVKINDGVITVERPSEAKDHKSKHGLYRACLLYTSPSPRDLSTSRMPSSA